MAARKVRKARKSRSSGATKTRAGFLSTATSDTDLPDYVVVELRYEAPVAFSAKRFAAPAAAEPQADSLNEALAKTGMLLALFSLLLSIGLVAS